MITRKRVILLLLVLVVLIGVTFVFLPQSPKAEPVVEEETEALEPTLVPVKQAVITEAQEVRQPTQVPTQEINPAQRWNTYVGESFKFQYPKDWTPQAFSMSDGGISVLVKPQVLPEGINYPQFILQSQPAAPEAISRKEGVLAGFGMQKSTEMLDGIEAIKYKGTIPYKIVGQQVVNESLQDTTYLLEKNGTLYVLKFEYEGASADMALDDFFDGFVFSFKTN